MTRSSRSRLSALCDAIGRPTAKRSVRFAQFFGNEIASTREHELGEPAIPVRKVHYRSGGEIVLHDDTVVGAILHVKHTASGAIVDLADWIKGVDNDATLKDVEHALGSTARFSGLTSPYLAVGAGYALLRFTRREGSGGWQEPGHLTRIVVTAQRPGLAVPPDADECPTCSTTLARGEHGVDVGATLQRLEAAVSAQALTEDSAWVSLGDLQALHASGLMRLVESHLTCTDCGRVTCFTLPRNGSATFGHHVPNEAIRRPMEPIPPIEQWGSPDRIAAARKEMRYVDHQPGAWFLVRHGDVLYLDARYSYSGIIDDAALIELDASERVAYRHGGHEYLSELAMRIDRGAPYQQGSPYYARDLYRRGGEPHRDYRREVSTAIRDHTWLAQQRSRPS